MERQRPDLSPMPRFDILPHPLKRLGGAVLGLFQMHQLASHGDHFQGADEMLLEEPTGVDQLTFGFDSEGRYLVDER